jgi:hypothetical protein
MSLATFFEIKEATANSIIDIEVMTAARDIAHEFAQGDSDKLDYIASLMFAYSSLLASTTATSVSHLLMGDDFDTMAQETLEMEAMFNQAEKDNN